jgi:DNA-binding transcriptional LysR family regulator
LDVAVRLAPLPDSGIVATRLGEVRKLLCASPSYVGRAAPPRRLPTCSAMSVSGTKKATPARSGASPNLLLGVKGRSL